VAGLAWGCASSHCPTQQQQLVVIANPCASWCSWCLRIWWGSQWSYAVGLRFFLFLVHIRAVVAQDQIALHAPMCGRIFFALDTFNHVEKNAAEILQEIVQPSECRNAVLHVLSRLPTRHQSPGTRHQILGASHSHWLWISPP
jgi:hypothetical protein